MDRGLGLWGIATGLASLTLCAYLGFQPLEPSRSPVLSATVTGYATRVEQGRTVYTVTADVTGQEGNSYPARSVVSYFTPPAYSPGDRISVRHFTPDTSRFGIVRVSAKQTRLLLLGFGLLAIVMGAGMAFGGQPAATGRKRVAPRSMRAGRIARAPTTTSAS